MGEQVKTKIGASVVAQTNRCFRHTTQCFKQAKVHRNFKQKVWYTHQLVDEELDLLGGTTEAAGSNLGALGVQHHGAKVGLAVHQLAVVHAEALVQVRHAQVGLLIGLQRKNRSEGVDFRS